MAMKKEGISLPFSLAPAFAEFGAASAKVPLTLAKESFELHVGAVAKAVGVGKAFFGKDSSDLINLGTRLMSFNWPAMPNFNKVGVCGWGLGGCCMHGAG